MCGIVGYIGQRDSVPIILDSLARLEYRGYDSAGIAVIDEHVLKGSKSVGKLARLVSMLHDEPLHGTIGLGHTRWATHGRPNDVNAHPHLDCTGSIAVVHNGIIENYAELRERLKAQGHRFVSETDTEVISHLIESHDKGDIVDAVRRTLAELRGAFGLGVISSKDPTALIFARNGASPLIVGVGQQEMFVASDIPALLQYTRDTVVIQEGELVVVGSDGYKLTSFEGAPIDRKVMRVTWSAAQAEKSGYKHFMLKEIFEQPSVVKETLAGRIDENFDVRLEQELGSIDDEMLRAISKICITGCGTAYHAGMVGMYLLRSLVGLPIEMELASEFRYGDPVVDPAALVLAISQSGETADTIEAAKIAKHRGASLLGICNVVGSHLTRLDDGTLFTRGGPEIGVAATKTYTAQVTAMILTALHLARVRATKPAERLREIAQATSLLPAAIDVVLNESDRIKRVARTLSEAQSVLFLGRYINYPTALEGALKLKEISYIHAEGYAAGEMKHGPIALLDHRTPVVAVVTSGHVREKILSNIAEAKAREAPIICIGHADDADVAEIADEVIPVPRVEPLLAPVVNVIALQLLAYHIADFKGCDVDQPRNLAKTVTVE